jgi:hypothetical protein
MAALTLHQLVKSHLDHQNTIDRLNKTEKPIV